MLVVAKYDGADFIVTGGHIFYDDACKISKREMVLLTIRLGSKRSFASGTYDLKDEVLTTDGSFIMNYDGYKLMGTALNYAFLKKEETEKTLYYIERELENIGVQWKINTIENIFAEK